MMAIGNNLPMLAEELQKAQKEVEDLKKQGKSFTPVWKQAFQAVFNWQTGLLVAITLLTAYGDEVADFIKEIFNMNKALKSTAEMQEAINKSLTDNTGSYGKQVTEVKKLQTQWKDLGGDLQKQKKFIIENKDAFEDLGVKVSSVADAENLLVTNTDQFIKALQARAMAEAGYNLATEEYEKALRKRVEAEAMADKVQQKQYSGGRGQHFDIVWVENAKKKAANEAADAFERQGDAYIGMGEKRQAEAKKILDDARIKEDENKRLEEEKKRLEELQRAKDTYLQKLEAYEQARKDAILKGEKAATDAMKEGYSKQLKQMEDAHKAEMNALEKDKSELLQKKIEMAEAQAKTEGKSFKASDVKLSADEEKVFESRQKDTTNRQKAEIQAFYDTLGKMQQAATMANASQLEQQLFDIDTYYQEQIRLAEGFEELKTQLTKNWATERARAENEARLRENQRTEDLALMKSDTTYLGTGLTEMAEREKTEILIKYAQERVKILKDLGDEQSKAEAESLAKQIEAYNKQLKQPMSVKGWFDAKIFDKLKDKYEELGDTEEDAKGKAAGFFSGVQNGASQTVEAVGLLQTAFGGIDEGLDQVMSAVSSIAQGFASGGLIGGIAAVAGIAVQSIAKLGQADYSQYEAMKEQYESLIGVWDTLIEKKAEYVSIDFGTEAQKSGKEAIVMLEKEIEAYEELGKARLNAGAGWGSHSIGVRQKENMSLNASAEAAAALKKLKVDIIPVMNGRMTGLFDLTAEQLETLREDAPLFWAQLDDEVREYLEKIISCQDEINKMREQMNEAATGVSFDAFYDGFISTLTDMESDSEDFAEDFGNYLKNAIMQNIVAEKYRSKIQDLYDSFAKKAEDGLTEGETDDLRAAQSALAEELMKERDSLAQTFGWLTESTYKQEASKGGFASMNQETGDELNGRFTAFQISNEAISASTKQIAETINLVLSHLPNFDAVLSDILSQHATTNGYLEDIAKHTKTIKDFGVILQNIAENTKNL